jgi:hypothetical protein
MRIGPTTPTGKRLLDDLEGDPYALPDILAIEAEARQQERERLRPLVMALCDFLPVGFGRLDEWAALYDALLPEES